MMLTIADYLRDFARTDRDAECLPEEHICWEAADKIDELNAAIREAHSALDDHLGDTDTDHYETMDEMRDESPDQWAAWRLAQAFT